MARAANDDTGDWDICFGPDAVQSEISKGPKARHKELASCGYIPNLKRALNKPTLQIRCGQCTLHFTSLAHPAFVKEGGAAREEG